MHSLEQIKFMNTDAEIARRQKLARLLNRKKDYGKRKKSTKKG